MRTDCAIVVGADGPAIRPVRNARGYVGGPCRSEKEVLGWRRVGLRALVPALSLSLWGSFDRVSGPVPGRREKLTIGPSGGFMLSSLLFMRGVVSRCCRLAALSNASSVTCRGSLTTWAFEIYSDCDRFSDTDFDERGRTAVAYADEG